VYKKCKEISLSLDDIESNLYNAIITPDRNIRLYQAKLRSVNFMRNMCINTFVAQRDSIEFLAGPKKFLFCIFYLYFSTYSIKFLLKFQFKILFNLNKKNVSHIWVTGPPRKHTRHPNMG